MINLRNKKLAILTVLLIFCIALSPATASTSQIILQDDTPLSFDKNWTYADSPEYPIIYNNLEDYVDQLSDLHNKSDTGTHSSFVSMQALDGIYDTLTSDNITMPERPIYDPETDEFLYNQSAYESWRLDLEVAWTNIAHYEISAELCIYGGTQADEALQVDIWDNDGWINVILDVAVGWNNVSIAPSLVNETLELRFTGSNIGNTSIQSSWSIDVVLLHTWTTVYGSEYTENGLTQDLGNNLSRYIASVGEHNTWNGSHYHPYLWNDLDHIVEYADSRLEFYEQYAVLRNSSDLLHSVVDDMRWVSQYAFWDDEELIWTWKTLDLYQHSFLPAVLNNTSMTFGQSYTDGFSEMNVTYTFRNNDGVKIRIDFYAQTERRYRFAWQNSGIQGDILLATDRAEFDDISFSWSDVDQSEMDVWHEWTLATKKLNVYFGNRTIGAGESYIVDPSYSVASDLDDVEWNIWDAPVKNTGRDHNRIGTDGADASWVAMFRVAMEIPQYAVVQDAFMSVYVSYSTATKTGTIKRIDEADVSPNLEGRSIMPSVDDSLTASIEFNGATGWKQPDVGPLVQKQLGLSGWSSGNYIGLRIESLSGVQEHRIDDYQYESGAGNHPAINVIFMSPSTNWLSGYAYRQGHSIDGKTGAGTYYQVKIHVEYGAGTSSGGTIYCDSHCDTDFDDIRFTRADGQTQLSYWMEEKTVSDDATFWVKVDADLGLDQVIYCYYGKSGDSTTSSGDNTFLFFDGFSGSSVNTSKWNIIDSSTPTVSGGILLLEGGATEDEIMSVVAWSSGVKQEVRAKAHDTTIFGRIASFRASADLNDFAIMMFRDDAANKVRTRTRNDGSSYDYVYDTLSTIDSWHNYGVYWLSSAVGWDQDRASPFQVATTYIPDASPDLVLWLQSGQGANDEIEVDWVFLRNFVVSEPAHYTWGAEEEAPNSPPTNDGTPTISNPDDGNKLYSRRAKYEVTTYHKDLDGFDDITHVEFSVYGDDRVTRYFYGRFVQEGAVFSEQGTTDQKNRWELDTVGSSHSETPPYDLDITWKFYIEWVATDVVNMDVRCSVFDAVVVTTDYYEVDWNIETDLEYQVTPYINDDDAGDPDHGDLNELFTITGEVKYEGSSDAIYPPSGEVDVWVRVTVGGYGSPSGPFEDDTIESDGIFTVTCYADNEVGEETYEIRIVAEGDGATGTDLVLGAEPTDKYIADKIIVQTTISDDAEDRLNINGNVEIRVTLWLAHDNSYLGAGDSVILDDVSMSWDAGNSWWELTRSKASVGMWTYYVNSSSETQYGVTGLDLNSKNVEVIWDKTIIQTTVADEADGRLDIDDNVEIRVTASLAYTGGGTVWLGLGDSVTLDDTAMSWDPVNSWWELTRSKASVGMWDYYVNSSSEATYGITALDLNSKNVEVIWDRVNLSLTTNLGWTIITYNATLSATGVFEYDSGSWSGVVTWANEYPSESIVGTYDYGASMISSITDPTYGVTVFAAGEEATVIFDDIVPSGSVNYYWTTPMPPNLDSVNLIWGAGSNWKWDYNDTLLNIVVILSSYSNGSAPSGVGSTYASGAFGGSTTGLYSGVIWDYVEFSVNATVTIAGINYDWEIWSVGMAVIVPHSLATSVWFLAREGDYYTLLMHTNYANASIMVWDDLEIGAGFNDSIYYGDYEGMHEWLRDVTVGLHNVTILLNAGADKGAVERDYVADDLRLWYNFTYAMADPPSYDCHIVIMNNLQQLIPFDTFEVYKNDSRIYHDIIQVVDGYGYNITIKNRFGDYVYLNTTDIFDAAHEIVIYVNIYSFKFMNWYNGFLRVNMTRGSVTYSEIIMPMETIEFRLYSENYDFSVDFLNGTTKHSFNIDLINSTGYVITGDTIADVFSLVNNVYDMVNAVNITVTTIEDNTITIQLMFDWSNTTLYNQTINIISAFNWDNTTLYNQTILIAAAFNATNTVLHNQIILIQNMFNWENTTLFNQTISILNAFNATNTEIYYQTVSILSNMSNMNVTIYGQTVSLLNYLYFNDASIYNQTIDIISTLSLIDSNITANYISLSASLVSINSTLLSNFTYVTAQLTLLDSSLLSNFTEVAATLLAIDSSLLSNFTYVMANLTAIGSNITTNYLSVSAMLSAIDSSLLSNFTSIAATLTLIDSNMLSNFTEVTATLAAIGSNVTSNYLSVSAALVLIDSNLYSNFTYITANLTAIGSNITSNFLAITAELSLIDSSLAANFTLIVAKIIASNSSIISQTLTIIANLEYLNATMFLIDDPTHLNPLVLGYSLSDDYCDFTIVTNWHNSSITIYDNDIPQTGPISELLSPIRYPLQTSTGTHNLSVWIDAGNDAFWYNISYTVAELLVTTAEMRLAFFDTANNWVPFETLNVTLAYGGITYNLSSSVATVDIAAEFNLTVRGRWGELLHNSTFNYTQFKTIILTVFELTIENEADHPCRVDLSYNGTYPNITIMVPSRFFSELYIPAANYSITFTYYTNSYESGIMINYEELTGYYVSYDIEITGICYLKYTGIPLTDVQTNIDFTRTSVNANVDAVDINVQAIPYPPPVPQNVVTPEDFWIIVLGFSAVAVLFAVFGHGIKGYQIAKKTKTFWQKPGSNSEGESYRDTGMPP